MTGLSGLLWKVQSLRPVLASASTRGEVGASLCSDRVLHTPDMQPALQSSSCPTTTTCQGRPGHSRRSTVQSSPGGRSHRAMSMQDNVDVFRRAAALQLSLKPSLDRPEAEYCLRVTNGTYSITLKGIPGFCDRERRKRYNGGRRWHPSRQPTCKNGRTCISA